MNPVFIDFEASSLSPKSWPIEVAVARIFQGRIVCRSKLIRPAPSWAMADWHSESEEVHGIPLEALEAAEPAEDVAGWLREELKARLVLSDAPEFDQRWCDRLMRTIGGAPEIRLDDFDRVAWQAFSSLDGQIASEPGSQRARHIGNRVCLFPSILKAELEKSLPNFTTDLRVHPINKNTSNSIVSRQSSW